MGKQVNFYMLEQDETAFMAFALQDPDVQILAPANVQDCPLILEELPAGRSPYLDSSTVYLSRKNQPIFLRSGVMQVGELAGQTLYLIEPFDSSVIEFYRCFLRPDRPDTLTSGRLWTEMRRLTPDKQAFEYKGDEFKKWYDSLARWIRRRYHRVGDRYVGPRAYEWHLAGGILQP